MYGSLTATDNAKLWEAMYRSGMRTLPEAVEIASKDYRMGHFHGLLAAYCLLTGQDEETVYEALRDTAIARSDIEA